MCTTDGTANLVEDVDGTNRLWSISGAGLQDRTPLTASGPNLMKNGDFDVDAGGADANPDTILFGMNTPTNIGETSVTKLPQDWSYSGGGTASYVGWGGMAPKIWKLSKCGTGCSLSMVYPGNGWDGKWSGTKPTFNADGVAQEAGLVLIPMYYTSGATGPYGSPTTPTSLAQTVSGLTVGNRYRLQFFVGSEHGKHTPTDPGWGFSKAGVAAIEIEGYTRTYFEVLPYAAGARYMTLDFIATANPTTIAFLNW